MRKNFIICLIVSVSFLNCSTGNNVNRTQPAVKNTDSLQFRTPDGKIITIDRHQYDSFSMVHPINDYLKPEKNEINKYVIPVAAIEGLSVMIQTEFIRNAQNADFKNFIFKELKENSSDRNAFRAIWAEDTFYSFPKSELVMGNSIDGCMIMGISTANMPMKIFLLRGYFLSPQSKDILKFTGIIMVEPHSEYYEDFDEINSYLYDLKAYFLTARFE